MIWIPCLPNTGDSDPNSPPGMNRPPLTQACRNLTDLHVAPVIQSSIQRFLCPWYRLRAKSIFRDLSCLPAGSSLEAELFDRLDRSTHLIVLASPEAAASEGMEMEARYWFSRPRNGQILIIVSSGDGKTWDRIREHLIPPSVRANLQSAPIWASIEDRRRRIVANPTDPQLHEGLIEDMRQVLLSFYPDRDWGQLRRGASPTTTPPSACVGDGRTVSGGCAYCFRLYAVCPTTVQGSAQPRTSPAGREIVEFRTRPGWAGWASVA